MKTRLFTLELTHEQLDTIITALRLELAEIRSSDHARKLLEDALQAVNAAQVKN